MQAEQEAFDHAWAAFGQQHSTSTVANSSNHPYQFHPSNPYDGNPDALALAQQAFKEGSLQDACLALEAVVKASPGNHCGLTLYCDMLPHRNLGTPTRPAQGSRWAQLPRFNLHRCIQCERAYIECAGDAQAWRLLGAAHAENDNDAQAIAAALRALDAAPDNAGVLLALGVSHVNELQEGEAVTYLLRCALCPPCPAIAVVSSLR